MKTHDTRNTPKMYNEVILSAPDTIKEAKTAEPGEIISIQVSREEIEQIHSIVLFTYKEFLKEVKDTRGKNVLVPTQGICFNMIIRLHNELSHPFNAIKIQGFSPFARLYSFYLVINAAKTWKHPLKRKFAHTLQPMYPIKAQGKNGHLWRGKQLEARISLLEHIIQLLVYTPPIEVLGLVSTPGIGTVRVLPGRLIVDFTVL